MRGKRNLVLSALALAAAGLAGVQLVTADSRPVGERLLLDKDRLAVYELTFPPGFRGDEHVAVADEFAYVLEGEFGVVTKGRGKRVLRRGEIEYAARGTRHYSVNESKRPARVLVVLVRER